MKRADSKQLQYIYDMLWHHDTFVYKRAEVLTWLTMLKEHNEYLTQHQEVMLKEVQYKYEYCYPQVLKNVLTTKK